MVLCVGGGGASHRDTGMTFKKSNGAPPLVGCYPDGANTTAKPSLEMGTVAMCSVSLGQDSNPWPAPSDYPYPSSGRTPCASTQTKAGGLLLGIRMPLLPGPHPASMFWTCRHRTLCVDWWTLVASTDNLT